MLEDDFLFILPQEYNDNKKINNIIRIDYILI